MILRSFIIIIVVALSHTVYGQEVDTMADSNYYHLAKHHHLNLSIGTLNTTNFSFSLFGGTGAGDPSPSINLEYMYGLSKDFGIGAHFNFYQVDAQQVINLGQISEDIFEDPLCFIACQTGIGLGASCDCDAVARERIEFYTIALKGAYHIKRIRKLDTYTSFIAGYSFNRRNSITEELLGALLDEVDLGVSIPKFVYHGSIGVRYYLYPTIALYGEYGAGNVHTLRLGGTYRFME